MISNPSLSDRDIRQRSLVPPERLAACQAFVIGVGAVGRQVALQLAALGIKRMTLVDHDQVEVQNLASQSYWPENLGQSKVRATAQLCQRIFLEVEVISKPERFRRSMVGDFGDDLECVLFLCVDRIATRRWIWEACRHRLAFFADARMHGEVIRVLATDGFESAEKYPQSLFEPSEAYAGACTSRSTIFAAAIAAGLMISQFTKWLRRLPVDPDLSLNLLATELVVAHQERNA